MDKNYFQNLMVMGILLFISACNSNGKKHETIKTGVQSTLAETLDTVLEANLNDDNAGLIISVWQNDVNLYTGMKGIAKPYLPITENTQFRLASVSKTFTAIAILKLYEQGFVDLEDSILDYLPELDQSWQDISLHHLLVHQSGIPDIFNDLETHQIIDNEITNDKIFHYFIENPMLEFNAGSNEDYSNTGYVLLAKIVNIVTGNTFASYMESEIFSPLGMNHSYILDEHAEITEQTAMNLATEHKIFGRESFSYGSAAQVSSMVDMQRFLSAFMTGKILQPETKALMMTTYSPPDESLFNGTGYGIFYFSDDGKTVYGHTGGHDGFRTIYAINREKNAFIVILGNGGDYMPDYSYMVELAAEFLE